MRFHVIRSADSQPRPKSASRGRAETGREVGWVNRYLDREYVRRLADTTPAQLRLQPAALRALVGESSSYRRHLEADLTESTLLDYLRFQCGHQPPPSASTINDRVAVADRAIRNEFPDAPCQMAPRLSASLSCSADRWAWAGRG